MGVIFLGGENMYPDYVMQAQLQNFIEQKMPSRIKGELHSRTACAKYPIIGTPDNLTGTVRVNRTVHGDGKITTHYLGLAHCQNSWSCPVCTPLRILQYRETITEAIKKKNSEGYIAVMVTLTIPHYRYQSASCVIQNLRWAKNQWDQWLKGLWRRKKLDFDINGSVTSTECKYNRKNGWHFHNHIVYFIKKWQFQLFLEFEQTARTRWLQIVKPITRFPTNELGCTFSRHVVKDGSYLAKEICKVDGKEHSENSGVNVFDLLGGDDDDKALFCEYAVAVKKLSRIHCSTGLLNGINRLEIKKNVLNELNIIEDETVCTFTYDTWNDILRQEYEDGIPHRAFILEAAKFGFEKVFEYCLSHVLRTPCRGEEIYSAVADNQ